jgi:hypothetical protein
VIEFSSVNNSLLDSGFLLRRSAKTGRGVQHVFGGKVCLNLCMLNESPSLMRTNSDDNGGNSQYLLNLTRTK